MKNEAAEYLFFHREALRMKKSQTNSSRARETMHQDLSGANVANVFAAFTGSVDDSAQFVQIPPRISTLLDMLTKKDVTTRIKALSELVTDTVSESDTNGVVNSLENLVQAFVRGSLFDPSWKCRSLYCRLIPIIYKKTGRSLEPHLEALVPWWVLSQFDPSNPDATSSFHEVFSTDEKRTRVISHYFLQISQLISRFLSSSPESLASQFRATDNRDEFEENDRFDRVRCACYSSIQWLIDGGVHADESVLLSGFPGYAGFDLMGSVTVRKSLFSLILIIPNFFTSLPKKSLTQLIRALEETVLSDIDTGKVEAWKLIHQLHSLPVSFVDAVLASLSCMDVVRRPDLLLVDGLARMGQDAIPPTQSIKLRDVALGKLEQVFGLPDGRADETLRSLVGLVCRLDREGGAKSVLSFPMTNVTAKRVVECLKENDALVGAIDVSGLSSVKAVLMGNTDSIDNVDSMRDFAFIVENCPNCRISHPKLFSEWMDDATTDPSERSIFVDTIVRLIQRAPVEEGMRMYHRLHPVVAIEACEKFLGRFFFPANPEWTEYVRSHPELLRQALALRPVEGAVGKETPIDNGFILIGTDMYLGIVEDVISRDSIDVLETLLHLRKQVSKPYLPDHLVNILWERFCLGDSLIDPLLILSADFPDFEFAQNIFRSNHFPSVSSELVRLLFPTSTSKENLLGWVITSQPDTGLLECLLDESFVGCDSFPELLMVGLMAGTGDRQLSSQFDSSQLLSRWYIFIKSRSTDPFESMHVFRRIGKLLNPGTVTFRLNDLFALAVAHHAAESGWVVPEVIVRDGLAEELKLALFSLQRVQSSKLDLSTISITDQHSERSRFIQECLVRVVDPGTVLSRFTLFELESPVVAEWLFQHGDIETAFMLKDEMHGANMDTLDSRVIEWLQSNASIALALALVSSRQDHARVLIGAARLRIVDFGELVSFNSGAVVQTVLALDTHDENEIFALIKLVHAIAVTFGRFKRETGLVAFLIEYLQDTVEDGSVAEGMKRIIHRAVSQVVDECVNFPITDSSERLWDKGELGVVFSDLMGCVSPGEFHDWATSVGSRSAAADAEKLLCRSENVFESLVELNKAALTDVRQLFSKSARLLICHYSGCGGEIKAELQFSFPSTWPARNATLTVSPVPGLSKAKNARLQMSVQHSLRMHGVQPTVQIWTENIEGFLKNVEECYICYSITHHTSTGSGGAIPDKQCKNCNNKFHAQCLFKWFKQSQKTNCVLCQQPW
jgi:hypothetical protein